MGETKYTKKDGFRAIFLYIIGCIYPVINSDILPYSNLSIKSIETSQWLLPIIATIICLVLVKIEKRSFKTIGFTFIKSMKPIVVCIIGTIVMIIIEAIWFYIFDKATHISTNIFEGMTALIMFTSVAEEEIS